jgi:hypothetical protein
VVVHRPFNDGSRLSAVVSLISALRTRCQNSPMSFRVVHSPDERTAASIGVWNALSGDLDPSRHPRESLTSAERYRMTSFTTVLNPLLAGKMKRELILHRPPRRMHATEPAPAKHTRRIAGHQ